MSTTEGKCVSEEEMLEERRIVAKATARRLRELADLMEGGKEVHVIAAVETEDSIESILFGEHRHAMFLLVHLIKEMMVEKPVKVKPSRAHRHFNQKLN